MIQPLVSNEMGFDPAINGSRPGTLDDPKDDSPGDPETFWEMLCVVAKLAIGPMISMVF